MPVWWTGGATGHGLLQALCFVTVAVAVAAAAVAVASVGQLSEQGQERCVRRT